MTTTLTRGYTFGATEQVTNSKLHSLVDSGTITNLDENVLASGRGLVVSSTSAPSNTACVWNDTGNNLLKAYISSAWTNVADGSLFSNLANVPSGAGVLPVANGGAVAATQAEMETGSSTTAVVTPGRQQFHPSAAKAWVIFNGTGTPAVITSYNVDSSITDNGTCDYTLSWTTDFSSANYAVAGMCAPVATAGHFVSISDNASPAAGTFRVETFAHDNSQGADSAKICVVAYGDQ